MCKEWDADAGYLYLFDETKAGEVELTHIASLGALTARKVCSNSSIRISARGGHHAHHDRGFYELSIRPDRSARPSSPTSEARPTNPRRSSVSSMAWRAMRESPSWFNRSGRRRRRAGLIASAIGARLIRIGDARGVPVAD